MTAHPDQTGETFMQRRLRLKAEREQRPTSTGTPAAPVDLDDRRAATWLQTALDSKTADLAAMPPDSGRNAATNAAAYALGRFAPHWLTADQVGTALLSACHRNGLAADDGEPACRATISSGITAGMRDPRDPPLRADDGAGGLSDLVAGPVVIRGGSPLPSPPAPDSPIFDATDQLDQIRQWARARMTSPTAVLGVALVRVLATVPPHVVLPPIVGGTAPVNLFAALVGPSGAGKGAAEAVARDAITILPDPYTATAGSGEGLAALYVHREKKELVQDRQAVILSVPEVDGLGALGARQGSTLMSALRQGWSGETLGYSYVDPAKRLPVERGTYRLGVVVGVQPGRAAVLLDESDGGTPQRFIWLPALDPGAPDTPPATPAPLTLPRVSWSTLCRNHMGTLILTVCARAATDITAARQATLRGQTGALDGHGLQTRLRVALALAVLHGRGEVTDTDWDLSAMVMTISDATRESVVSHLARQARETNTARGRADGERAEAAADVTAEKAVARISRRIAGMLSAEPVAMSELRRRVSSRDREWVPEAVEALRLAGQATVEPVDNSGAGVLVRGVAK